jgi:hypothetical protein
VGCPVTSIEQQRLNFAFDIDQYACVLLDGEATEQIIFIHSLTRCPEALGSHPPTMLCTRFSPLVPTFSFVPEEPRTDGLYCGELLLHFGDFEMMGRPEDGDKIRFDDIISAAALISSDRAEWSTQHLGVQVSRYIESIIHH